ncbi:ABC transporter ATP-binding protein/permease [Deefgea salmonis]|uniref:ABC transporter ATP-binding protein/permease n=1 Tax=Deefgea salmonis TaxID=2875502 RepID=A0ABS8BJU5_9NEIS|nr:ABC transporter ATP-binding protein/permease [Deefgea salmonis]MCB5195992.1 ABC transporter ATP-binding protein/permease [Deefgea salmonis]
MNTNAAQAPKVNHLFRNFWQLAKPYWVSEEKYRAWGLLALIIALSLGMVFMNVQFNSWYKEFYDTMQNLDKKGFEQALYKFGYLAFIYIVIAVYAMWFQQMLEIRWRRWATAHFTARWLSDNQFYRIQLTDKGTDNPDQRIAEDVGQFISISLSLSLGLLRALVTLVSFIGILWTLSGPISFMLAGSEITIHGYMVWVAIIYAVIGSLITVLLGRPLVSLNFLQQRFEADFRFGLIRVRENAESIALYQGGQEEQQRLSQRFAAVVDNFWALMRRNKKLTWFTSFWGQLAIIFPLMVAAPRFFAKEISFGGLMQINSAFGQVYGALDFVIGSFSTLANWKAIIDRLSTFETSLQAAQALPRLAVKTKEEGIEWRQISVSKPNGQLLIENLNLQLHAGDSVLIRGASGAGKSSLLRTLAGLWPYASGELAMPQTTQTLFLSQKPYMPLGTLRAALYYPQAARHEDATLADLLELAGLSHLLPRLDEVDSWSHVLSLGEQQRVALLRVLLLEPDFLLMDESSSALDAAGEAKLYAAVAECMKQGVMVSVGHRSGLIEYHRQVLDCQGQGQWSLNH